MKRPRHPPAPQRRFPPARLQKVKLRKELNLILHAQPRIEIEQVMAATNQNMLAIVDHLGFFPHRPGSSPSTDKSPAFQNLDFVSRTGKRGCSRKAGKAPAKDHN